MKKNLVLILMLGSFFCSSQDTVLISRKVGKVIDAAEKSEYRLFPWYSSQTFEKAVLVLTSDGAYQLRSVINGSVAVRDLSQTEVEATHVQIEGLPPASVAPGGIVKSVIILHSGAEYIGEIISDDGREVLLSSDQLGRIYVPKSDIKAIKKLQEGDETAHGEYAAEGPFTTRYAFTNNALPIRKGENYAMVHLYGPEVHFAVTNRFNVGFMSTWIASPMLLAMKYTFKTDESRVNFSAGTLLGTSGYLNTFKTFGGLHWLSMTLGDRRNNITFSGGYGYIQPGRNNLLREGSFSDPPQPSPGPAPLNKGLIGSVAGIARVGAKASFIMDCMLFTYSKQTSNVTQEMVSAPTTSTQGEWKFVVNNTSSQSVFFVLMPGMRFQTTDRKAFQFVMAGVMTTTKRGRSAFPLPMCTWFHRF